MGVLLLLLLLNPYYQKLAPLIHAGFAKFGHPCVDLRFFGPQTLATMHQAEDLSSQGDFMGVSTSGSPQYGVLDSSFHFDYRKEGLFEVRVLSFSPVVFVVVWKPLVNPTCVMMLAGWRSLRCAWRAFPHFN